MRKLILVAVLVGGFALPAAAYDCVQTDGQPGIHLVGIEGDAGCQTADEYAQVFSVPNLVDAGVLTVVADNGDGTVNVLYNNDGTGTLIAEALERPVAANPSEFDTAPTVREVLYPATAFRLAALIG